VPPLIVNASSEFDAEMTNITPVEYKTPDGLTLRGDVGGLVGAPTLVMAHGGGQTRHSWSRAMNHLIDKGYRVLVYDARGHGDSDWAPDANYTVDAMAADIRVILDTIAGPIVIVGASMGGLAAFYAIGAAERKIADALVLADIVINPAEEGAARTRAFMSAHQGGFATLEDAADAIAAYTGHKRSGNLDGLRRNLRLRDDGRFYWHWDGRLLDQDLTRRMHLLDEIAPKVTLPVMLVRGGKSVVTNAQNAAEMKQRVPQMEIQVLPNAGHMITGDDNEAFVAGLDKFLRRHIPRA
jgi:pimeloyl-ACP methyl ester carboxylesterase